MTIRETVLATLSDFDRARIGHDQINLLIAALEAAAFAPAQQVSGMTSGPTGHVSTSPRVAGEAEESATTLPARAAPVSEGAKGWRAMDSAPKDGTRILLAWEPKGGFSEHVELGKWCRPYGWCNTYGKPFSGAPDAWAELAPFALAGEAKAEPVAWTVRDNVDESDAEGPAFDVLLPNGAWETWIAVDPNDARNEAHKAWDAAQEKAGMYTAPREAAKAGEAIHYHVKDGKLVDPAKGEKA